ncbi:unnamed protein product [Lupinus luteus]|uniref:Uncharacterized protein n=1 Tax=Lupinus luteus TaxID=3873 RepID=A0AAV1XH98_LUPLU
MSEFFVFSASHNSDQVRPPDKPPDKDSTIPLEGSKISFRDKVLADRHPVTVREDKDFLAEGLARVELIGVPDTSRGSAYVEGSAMPSSTPINDELNAYNHSITVGDDLHGDWLVVTRRRRNVKSSKGGNDMLATDTMASKNNKFAALSMAGTTLTISNIPGGRNVINGAIIGGTSTNKKKKIRMGNKSDTDQEVGVILNDFMGVNESLNTLP